MILPIIKYKETKYTLVVKKRYACKYPIISLGYDCHPAYILTALNLRTMSFPFDWQLTHSSKGIDYVNQNLQQHFKLFVCNLDKNKRGGVVSGHYPDSEFTHYPDLINAPEKRKTIKRRCARFLDYFYKKKCVFLFNVSSWSFKNSREISIFLESVKEFHRLARGNHLLLVYIRYDDSLNENELNCEIVKEELRKLRSTKVTQFIRYKSSYGIWGNEDKYVELLESLGVKLKLTFPKVYLSKR